MRLFKRGERVRLTDAPFADIEGICEMVDGERRAVVLIRDSEQACGCARHTDRFAQGKLANLLR